MHSLLPNSIRIAALLILGLIIVILFHLYVPYNMDEFCFYHTIICHHYEYNHLNYFREACFETSLNVLNTGFHAPLLSSNYAGNFPSVYYYPLFLLWKSPLSARFMGILFLLMQAFILHKMSAIKMEWLFIGLLSFFPYSFQHIVDTGAVALQTTLVILVYYLTLKWKASHKLVYPVCISFLIFLGVWTKVTYIWLLPGIGLIIMLNLVGWKGPRFPARTSKKLIVQFVVFVLLCIGLWSVIYLSPSSYDSSLYPYLDKIAGSPSARVFSIGELLSLETFRNSAVIKALLNPFTATERIFYVRQASSFTYLYYVLIYLAVPFMWLASIFFVKNGARRGIRKSIILYASFLITLIGIFLTKGSFGMHHVILAFPFLILSFIEALKCLRSARSPNIFLFKRMRKIPVLLILLCALNSFFFISFPKQEIRDHDDFSKSELNMFLRNEDLAENYVYVVIDWGMYYYQGLYGDKSQCVVYIEPFFMKQQMDDLLRIRGRLGRKLLIIYNSQSEDSDLAYVRNYVPLEPSSSYNNETVWRILLEK